MHVVGACVDVFSASTLNTMRVKEICRRQLLAKTSAAAEKSVPVVQPASCGRSPAASGKSPAAPSTPSFSTPAASPLSSLANIAQSPGPISVQQRSPSLGTLESLRPAESVSAQPSPVAWHAPAVSGGSTVSDVRMHRSPRTPSNSADSSDGSANQQFAVVSFACLGF